jgi:hypothetical protein
VEKKDTFIKAMQQNEGLIYKVATFYTNSKEAMWTKMVGNLL